MFNASTLPRLLFLIATIAAIVVALRAKKVAVRSAAWGVMFACWIGAQCSGGNAWESASAETITWITLAVPPLALVLVSWRMRRGQADTTTAEVGLLVLIFFAQWTVVFSFGYQFVQVLIWFLFLAAAFIAAAIPLPPRRIAYGAAALTFLLLGVFREWLLWSDSGQHPDIPFNDDILVGLVYAGIPIVGAALQILWWLKHRKDAA